MILTVYPAIQRGPNRSGIRHPGPTKLERSPFRIWWSLSLEKGASHPCYKSPPWPLLVLEKYFQSSLSQWLTNLQLLVSQAMPHFWLTSLQTPRISFSQLLWSLLHSQAFRLPNHQQNRKRLKKKTKSSLKRKLRRRRKPNLMQWVFCLACPSHPFPLKLQTLYSLSLKDFHYSEIRNRVLPYLLRRTKCLLLHHQLEACLEPHLLQKRNQTKS